MHQSLRVLPICVALALSACSTETTEVGYEQLDRPDVPTWEAFKAASTIQDDHGNVFFVIEGDFAVSEAHLYRHYEDLYLRNVDKSSVWVDSAGHDIVWSATEKTDITYCVADTFGDKKSRAVADMRVATSFWMSAANVVFRYVPSQDSVCSTTNTGVRLNVVPWTGGGVGCAPHDCRHLGMDYNGNFGNYTWTGAWTHEAGHTLGLAHEHDAQPCGSGDGLRVINSYDISSAMHYDTVCGSRSMGQMTPTDADGVKSLYGTSSTNFVAVLPPEWIVASEG
jgi:serralysin